MPASVTNGTVNFLRRIKTGDYEHKEASVTLNFSVPEDMGVAEAAGWVERIGQMAETKAHVMLGLVKSAAVETVRAVENVAAPTISEVKASIAKAEAPAPAATEPPKHRGRPPGSKNKPKEETADTAASIEDEPAPEASQKPGDEPAVVDEGDPFGIGAEPEPEPITDADLIGAVTKKNAEIKAPARIKEVIYKFVTAPKTVRDMAQEVRQAFLDELAKLAA